MKIDTRARWRKKVTMLCASVLGGLGVASCAASDGGSELGTQRHALLPASICNQGAGAVAIAPRWVYTYIDTYGATGQVEGEVVNRSSGPIKVSVSVRGRGLDRRDVSRVLWEEYILPGDKHTQLIAIGDFPVQSLDSKSAITLEAVVTAAPDQPHLVGLKLASEIMAVRFLPGYALAEISGTDMTQPAFIEGNGDTMTLAQLTSQLAAHLPGQLSRAGRVWNGSSMIDVTTLPVTKDVTGTHPLGRAGVFPPGDIDKITKVLERFPLGSAGTGDTFCFRLPGEYIDDGRGESIVAANQPARFVRALVVDEFGTAAFNGYLNQSGCTANFEAVSGRAYYVTMLSALSASGRNVRVRSSENALSAETLAFSLNGTTKLRAQLPTFELGSRTLPTMAQMLRAGTASAASSTRTLEIPSGNYEVKTTLCPAGYPACSIGNTIYLGPNPDNTHNVDWKFVVAHEFGHAMQDALSGVPLYDGAYNINDTNPQCSCNYVVDPNDRTHCMQSKETHSGAETESFAHFAAANTWNVASSTACKSIYYKRFIDGGVVREAPYAVDCTVKAKWLENTCLEANRGVEWDWMNWKRSVDSAPAAERSNMAAIADIYKRACGGVSCAGTSVTPAQLNVAARAKYGVGTPKAVRFENDIDQYGANH